MTNEEEDFLSTKQFSLLFGISMCCVSVLGVIANGISLSFFMK